MYSQKPAQFELAEGQSLAKLRAKPSSKAQTLYELLPPQPSWRKGEDQIAIHNRLIAVSAEWMSSVLRAIGCGHETYFRAMVLLLRTLQTSPIEIGNEHLQAYLSVCMVLAINVEEEDLFTQTTLFEGMVMYSANAFTVADLSALYSRVWKQLDYTLLSEETLYQTYYHSPYYQAHSEYQRFQVTRCLMIASTDYYHTYWPHEIILDCLDNLYASPTTPRRAKAASADLESVEQHQCMQWLKGLITSCEMKPFPSQAERENDQVIPIKQLVANWPAVSKSLRVSRAFCKSEALRHIYRAEKAQQKKVRVKKYAPVQLHKPTLHYQQAMVLADLLKNAAFKSYIAKAETALLAAQEKAYQKSYEAMKLYRLQQLQQDKPLAEYYRLFFQELHLTNHLEDLYDCYENAFPRTRAAYKQEIDQCNQEIKDTLQAMQDALKAEPGLLERFEKLYNYCEDYKAQIKTQHGKALFDFRFKQAEAFQRLLPVAEREPLFDKPAADLAAHQSAKLRC